jgi:hypothetical protein
MLQIGQKVICIDDSVEPRVLADIKNNFQQWVVKDEIYTIRDLIYNDIGVTTVLLVELRNTPIFFPKTIGKFQEPGFKMSRFAPLNSTVETLSEVDEHANVN